MKRYLLIEYDPADCGLEADSPSAPVMFDYLANEFENAKVVAHLSDFTLTGLVVHVGNLARKREPQPKKLKPSDIPKSFPVRPLKPGEPAKDRVTCGTCGLSWDDSKPTEYTPAPSARCPFEYYHKTTKG
jgi:hypothetical protein